MGKEEKKTLGIIMKASAVGSGGELTSLESL